MVKQTSIQPNTNDLETFSVAWEQISYPSKEIFITAIIQMQHTAKKSIHTFNLIRIPYMKKSK